MQLSLILHLNPLTKSYKKYFIILGGKNRVLYSVVKNILKPFLKVLLGVKVTGIENIPKESGCIVCSNHYHWLDPVIVACFTKRQIHFMAKKELYKNSIFA